MRTSRTASGQPGRVAAVDQLRRLDAGAQGHRNLLTSELLFTQEFSVPEDCLLEAAWGRPAARTTQNLLAYGKCSVGGIILAWNLATTTP